MNLQMLNLTCIMESALDAIELLINTTWLIQQQIQQTNFDFDYKQHLKTSTAVNRSVEGKIGKRIQFKQNMQQ